ncbi:M48 family metallopeptidase [Variovorax sp. OV329]|uniref:M48 family metallopeptidase n=1 Tax=Variovorax sp. OV329 TaxID=1882825 RepID=UPI0008F2F76F|nr:M48 family metallopeptidase [Variovorax sp. OV329]SFM14540.1 Peptidase family M48 [Variovorax sp. OV329]
MDATLRGRWFDGRSSQARPVLLRLAGDGRGRASLRLHPLDVSGAPTLQLGPGRFEWPDTWEPGSASPRLTVDLGTHGSLDVEGRAWHDALAACGTRASIAQRLQRRWRLILVALLATALIVWAFGRWGTPWLAGQLARHAPLEWELQISREALAQLDSQGTLRPSKLPRERQAQLQAAFKALQAQVPPTLQPDARYAPPISLQFRGGLGANAFALPGGTLVITDDMVALAGKQGLDDQALIGVLAHELGHVLHRHGTRRVIELSVLNVGMALVLGDVSGVVTTGGTLVAGLAYSRDHEREADCFAIALMQATGRPLAPMADLLLAAERSQSKAAGGGPGIDWLSTHPDTAVRAEAMKAGKAPACKRP